MGSGNPREHCEAYDRIVNQSVSVTGETMNMYLLPSLREDIRSFLHQRPDAKRRTSVLAEVIESRIRMAITYLMYVVSVNAEASRFGAGGPG